MRALAIALAEDRAADGNPVLDLRRTLTQLLRQGADGL